MPARSRVIAWERDKSCYAAACRSTVGQPLMPGTHLVLPAKTTTALIDAGRVEHATDVHWVAVRRRSRPPPSASPRHRAALALVHVGVNLTILFALLSGALNGSYAAGAANGAPAPQIPGLSNDQWNGLASSDDGPCAAYAYEIRIDGAVVGCTHGPDPAPPAVRSAGRVTLDDLRARTEQMTGGEGAVAATQGDVPCVGAGSSGLRTVAIYAYQAGAASRYNEIAPMIRTWAGAVDQIVDASAAQTGGSRHVRWYHDASCNVIVQQVQLSLGAVYGVGSDAGEDPFTMMINELINDGYSHYDRRYMVWVDASAFDTGICGIAMTGYDESAGPTNMHNGGANAGLGLIGRVDNDCWGVPAPDNSVEAHELTHTLGAVQPHSPYSSSVIADEGVYFYGHCVDEYDTMCYSDGTTKPLIYRCPPTQERLLDCGHDDYFNTNPSPSSYLGKNWNAAMNAFLVRNDPIAGFVDVGAQFRIDIAWLVASGITSGCTVDLERFCPNDGVTREQMASFLARGLNLPNTPNDYFTDDEASGHEVDINRVAAAGITSGCTATAYCPSVVVTRAQMASFLARALQLPNTANDYFTDDESSIHEIDINRVARKAITTGCTPTTYCPESPVTRGQMAAFLHRALD